jgi:hypothetical protein
VIQFYKITGFLALMAGWPLAYFNPDLHPTFMCWGYTGGAYGLAIHRLEKELRRIKSLLPELSASAHESL